MDQKEVYNDAESLELNEQNQKYLGYGKRKIPIPMQKKKIGSNGKQIIVRTVIRFKHRLECVCMCLVK